ncbi:MAG: transketolase [Bacteroidetes bacterium]|nr:MAG: transketolase [Bacteroidota bacterium]
MRKEFSAILEQTVAVNKKTVFITGDLGYNALEKLQSIAGNHFINAGVAEQNMVGVAAGLAYKGFEVFTYSIAPFAVYRCLEQIKLDVCIHNLPVYIVGNGGGYGYGIMGATHHAIEDIACLSPMPNMTCWIPAFQEDVAFCLSQITTYKKPAYLRLGTGIPYPAPVTISMINKVVTSAIPEITLICLGPIVHNALQAISENKNIDLFTVLAVPILELSDGLVKSIEKTKKVIVIEEHVERGGLGEHILSMMAKKNIHITGFTGLYAKGYPNKLYGNQAFHQKESGLNPENIKTELTKLLKI